MMRMTLSVVFFFSPVQIKMDDTAKILLQCTPPAGANFPRFVWDLYNLGFWDFGICQHTHFYTVEYLFDDLFFAFFAGLDLLFPISAQYVTLWNRPKEPVSIQKTLQNPKQ